MNLDKRLKEILAPAREDLEIESRESSLDGVEEAIKQAFIDEGWVQSKLTTFTSGYSEPKYMPGYCLDHKCYAGQCRNKHDKRVTGPEWLARSLAELEKTGLPQNSVGIKAVRDALRRAAGVDE